MKDPRTKFLLGLGVIVVAWWIFSVAMQSACWLFTDSSFLLLTRSGMRLAMLTVLVGIIMIAALFVFFLMEVDDIWFWSLACLVIGITYENPAAIFKDTMVATRTAQMLYAILFALVCYLSAIAIYRLRAYSVQKEAPPAS